MGMWPLGLEKQFGKLGQLGRAESVIFLCGWLFARDVGLLVSLLGMVCLIQRSVPCVIKLMRLCIIS
jgi:hypothetical protein